MSDHYYCDIEDLKKKGLSLPRIIELTNDNKSDKIDQDVFDGCRGSAAALIDSYCLNRYKDCIPFNPVPQVIVTIAVLLTKYFLYERKKAADDDINEMYKDQIRQLKDISQGTMDLGLDGKKVTEDSIKFTAKEPTDRVSHLDNLKGYFL